MNLNFDAKNEHIFGARKLKLALIEILIQNEFWRENSNWEKYTFIKIEFSD